MRVSKDERRGDVAMVVEMSVETLLEIEKARRVAHMTRERFLRSAVREYLVKLKGESK